MPNPDTLLRPDNHALLLIGHQYLQLLSLRSHPVEEVVANTVIAARGAKFFGVPTLFTNAFAERPGLVKDIQAVHSDQALTERTGLNSWGDQRVADWVKATGKRKLVIAGLWTRFSLTMPVLSTLADGYEVFILTDASGGSSAEAHERAVQRMIKAGAQPIAALAYISELQRDWKNDKTAQDVVKLVVEAGTTVGRGFRWVRQSTSLEDGPR